MKRVFEPAEAHEDISLGLIKDYIPLTHNETKELADATPIGRATWLAKNADSIASRRLRINQQLLADIFQNLEQENKNLNG